VVIFVVAMPVCVIDPQDQVELGHAFSHLCYIIMMLTIHASPLFNSISVLYQCLARCVFNYVCRFRIIVDFLFACQEVHTSQCMCKECFLTGVYIILSHSWSMCEYICFQFIYLTYI